MDYQVILSPRAIQDLQEVVRYISFDNADTAERLGLRLIAKTRVLVSFPELGRIVPEFNEPGIRELILTPFRIVYRINHERRVVEVSRYWHGARGTPTL